MKRILFVDDDAVILSLYQKALVQRGFTVETATDGIAAIKSLRASRPDVVVLDLMMPKFSGVDVLRFVRSEAKLSDLPVIVLTNSYLNDLAEQAVGVGIQQALLKVRCTPSILAAAIDTVAGGPTLQTKSPPEPPPSSTEPSSPAEEALQAPPPEPLNSHAPPAGPGPAVPHERENLTTVARQNLISSAARTRSEFQTLAHEFIRAEEGSVRDVHLQNLYRRTSFLGATAGLAECHALALLASAFEALLFELIHRPELITPSVRRTVVFTVDFIGQLLERASQVIALPARTAQVLVVDDDPLSNRLVTAALRRVQLNARSTEDPATALHWARETHFDLFLLDIEMPGLDGFELCKKIRVLPGYQRVPVIFVTSHSDFESRAKSILSGANDLIAKPVQPIELAVKTVTHLLRNALETQSVTR
jgi:CheY-like chemotaxis protein